MGKWLAIVFLFAMFVLVSANISFAAITVSINGTHGTNPVNNSNFTDITPEIRFNVTGDNLSYVVQLWVDGAVQGANFSVANSSTAHRNLTSLTSGIHRIRVEARNDTGGQAFLNSTLITITLYPHFSFANGVAFINQTINTSDATPEINFTFKGDNVTYEWAIWIDGAVNFTSSGVTVGNNNNTAVFYNLTALNFTNDAGRQGLSNGTHQVLIEVRNSSFNGGRAFFNATTNLTMFIDNQVPTVTITSPVNNTNTSDTTPEFYFNVTDNQTTTLTYRVWVNTTLEAVGVTSATNSSIIAFNLSAKGNGTSVIVVEVNDTAGNIVNSTPLHIIVDNTKPAPTLSVSPTSVETGKSVTITCSASDSTTSVNSTSVTIAKPGGGSETSSCGATYSNTGSTGTYTIKFTATDLVGNSQEVSVTFTTTNPGDTGTGTSGSGTTPAPVIIKSTNVFSELAPDVVHKIAVKKEEIGVKEIQIEIENKATNVEIVVQKLDTKPASVTQEVSGNVFQYIDISQKNIAENNLKSAKIKFRVSKSWLSANNVNENTVALNRYANGTWTKLSTTKGTATATEVEYEADTPGFSVFAITGEISTTPTTVPGATTTTTIRGATTTTTAIAGAPGAADNTLAIVAIVILVVLAGLYFFFFKKK